MIEKFRVVGSPEPTICVNCQHHISRWPGGRTGPSESTWYYQLCGAARYKEAIDPVSGEECYMRYNSMGERYYTDERHPYCREINTDGKCELYDAKEPTP